MLPACHPVSLSQHSIGDLAVWDERQERGMGFPENVLASNERVARHLLRSLTGLGQIDQLDTETALQGQLKPELEYTSE